MVFKIWKLVLADKLFRILLQHLVQNSLRNSSPKQTKIYIHNSSLKSDYQMHLIWNINTPHELHIHVPNNSLH